MFALNGIWTQYSSNLNKLGCNKSQKRLGTQLWDWETPFDTRSFCSTGKRCCYSIRHRAAIQKVTVNAAFRDTTMLSAPVQSLKLLFFDLKTHSALATSSIIYHSIINDRNIKEGIVDLSQGNYNLIKSTKHRMYIDQERESAILLCYIAIERILFNFKINLINPPLCSHMSLVIVLFLIVL